MGYPSVRVSKGRRFETIDLKLFGNGMAYDGLIIGANPVHCKKDSREFRARLRRNLPGLFSISIAWNFPLETGNIQGFFLGMIILNKQVDN
jgi:hypothetical protein